MQKNISKLYLSKNATNYLIKLSSSKRLSLSHYLIAKSDYSNPEQITYFGNGTTMLSPEMTAEDRKFFIDSETIAKILLNKKEDFEKLTNECKIEVVRVLLDFIRSNKFTSLAFYYRYLPEGHLFKNVGENIKKAKLHVEIMNLPIK